MRPIRMRWLALALVTASVTSAGAAPLAIAGSTAAPAPAKLHLGRGRVSGGCPADRHATCRGVETAAFDIDAAPVTRATYLRCVRAGACPDYGPEADGEEGTHGPTLGVDAGERYCRWRGERLPTEAEWERARLEAKGFVLPARPMIKELLAGWYTWNGPDMTDVPVSAGAYNSRLVIRMYHGASYRYGIHARLAVPDLTFRCVASGAGPASDPAQLAH